LVVHLQNVIKTLQAVCIMFDIKPDRVNDPDNIGKKINDWFKASQRNLLVSANKLLEDMQNYDKDNIPADIISKIEPFYNIQLLHQKILRKRVELAKPGVCGPGQCTSLIKSY